MKPNNLKILFFVEGFTDIRMVLGVAALGKLTLIVPARQFAESGLKERIRQSGIQVNTEEIEGGRLAYQFRSFLFLWRRARKFTVILSQELLRGTLNAALVGWMRGVPVVTIVGMPPVEYFRCRRERGQIGPLKAWLGESVIRALMTVNGRLVASCVACGPFLESMAARYCRRTRLGCFYGVDTDFFRPVSLVERRALRDQLGLPRSQFLIFFASRISHEKDPETLLKATAVVRSRGINACVMNLGGGYRDFLALARQLRLPDIDSWVIGKPAAHPMTELNAYYQTSDLVVQSSLEEGLGMSPLEALACGTPVVATAVGGLALALPGLAKLTPRQDVDAMANAIAEVAQNWEANAAVSLRAREQVVARWSRIQAFNVLREELEYSVQKFGPAIS